MAQGRRELVGSEDLPPKLMKMTGGKDDPQYFRNDTTLPRDGSRRSAQSPFRSANSAIV
jgi:hypothetical protein